MPDLSYGRGPEAPLWDHASRSAGADLPEIHHGLTAGIVNMRFDLLDFATRYTAAWCSQNAASVASFFSPDGSLTINDGPPSVGRAAITAIVQEFMTAFPDLRVMMDSESGEGGRAVYRWTLDGHNSGPGGTGSHVRISGYEEWLIGTDGLIAASLGHFDAADWQRQLDVGTLSR
jgi:SnoaL-like domain